MFVLPQAAVLHNSKGVSFPQMLFVSRPFSDFILMLVCLLCLPNLCPLSHFFFVNLSFSLSGYVRDCVHACMYVSLPSSLSPACTRTHIHTQSLPLCGLHTGSSDFKGTAWRPAGQPAGGQPECPPPCHPWFSPCQECCVLVYSGPP